MAALTGKTGNILSLCKRARQAMYITTKIRNGKYNKMEINFKRNDIVWMPKRSSCRQQLLQDQLCWKCGAFIDRSVDIHFCSCGVIQKPFTDDYFQLLGIDMDFDLDATILAKSFRDLQRKLHPDKFSGKSNQEKELSQEQASLVNRAYNILRHPMSRGLYMLGTHSRQPIACKYCK